MSRPTHATIDLSALRHNLGLARSLISQQRLMATVKANAYGHGVSSCAPVMADHAEGFAVACVEELQALTALELNKPLLVMQGFCDRHDLAYLYESGAWSVIHSVEQVTLLEQHAALCPGVLWLEVDTGMHRLGLLAAQLPTVVRRLRALGCQHLVLMSHYAQSESPHSALTTKQQERWMHLPREHFESSSMPNSAGSVNALSRDSDWARLGYLLYGGITPGAESHPAPRPVMSLNTQVIAIRDIAVGETVGYGGRWRANSPRTIATLPIGYGDGYPCSANDGTPVWIAGRCCPMVGRVSMDAITVDITDHPDATVGSPAQLWGDKLPVETVACHSHTIGYELMTRLSPRVVRQVIT